MNFQRRNVQTRTAPALTTPGERAAGAHLWWVSMDFLFLKSMSPQVLCQVDTGTEQPGVKEDEQASPVYIRQAATRSFRLTPLWTRNSAHSQEKELSVASLTEWHLVEILGWVATTEMVVVVLSQVLTSLDAVIPTASLQNATRVACIWDPHFLRILNPWIELWKEKARHQWAAVTVRAMGIAPLGRCLTPA